MNRGKKLNPKDGVNIFGKDAAEYDPHLSDYFLKTNTWDKVINGNSLLVLGRKGSGKSAIFKMLQEEGIENTNIIQITPRLFALDVLNEFINKYPENPLNEEIAYTVAWRYSLMLELLLEIENQSGTLQIGGEAGVHNWLRKNIEKDSDIISRTVAFLEKWTINKVSLSQLSVEIGTQAKRGSLVGQDIDNTTPYIEKSLSERKYIIAIDNLDEGWENNEKSRCYLVGLILAAREMSKLANLNVVVFMRNDVYRALETSYQHLDKFRESVDYIRWDPQSLNRLISLRIQNFFQVKNESNEASWKRLFPLRMENNFETYKHIVERTFLRPREMIQYCRLTIENAANFKKQKADPRDVRDAESLYSEWKLSDLAGEFSSFYINLYDLLYFFRRSSYKFTSSELKEETEKAIESTNFHPVDGDPKKLRVENVISLLYHIGFIRAYEKDKRGRWKYITSAIVPNLNISRIDYWDLHPAFRSQLIISY